MTKSRTWFTSRFEKGTELYIETRRYQGADGMPRTDCLLLAVVLPKGYQYQAQLWISPDTPGIMLKPKFSQEGAMQLVIDHFNQHDPIDELS